jgi:hypothetical protein
MVKLNQNKVSKQYLTSDSERDRTQTNSKRKEKENKHRHAIHYLPANLERDRVKDRIQRGHHIGQQRRRTSRADERKGRDQRRRAPLERVLVEKVEDRVVDQRAARLWRAEDGICHMPIQHSQTKMAVHETRVEQTLA